MAEDLIQKLEKLLEIKLELGKVMYRRKKLSGLLSTLDAFISRYVSNDDPTLLRREILMYLTGWDENQSTASKPFVQEEILRKIVEFENLPQQIASVDKSLHIFAKFVEILEVDVEIGEDLETGGTKFAVLETLTNGKVFLPYPGCTTVDCDILQPGDLVVLSRNTFLITKKFPSISHLFVKPKLEGFGDVCGLEQQIQELKFAIVNPLMKRAVATSPSPCPVLLLGEPGSGKTLAAYACATQVKSHFVRITGPQLAEKGAMLVRDTFRLAKKYDRCMILIDGIEALPANRGSALRCPWTPISRLTFELRSLNLHEHNIPVVATANSVDVVDVSLTKPQYFHNQIELPTRVNKQDAEC